MGKQTIFESIKEWLAGKCWKYFLKFNNLTEDEYFRQIKEQESRTNESRPVEKLVMPKIAEVYAGKITISRTTSNVENDYMSIEIRTEKMLIRCKITMENYAFAISGLSMQPLDVEIR